MARTCGNWWTCSDNVMCDIVFHWCVTVIRSRDCRVVLHVHEMWWQWQWQWEDWTQCRSIRCGASNSEGCSCVDQLLITKINKEIEMSQGVSAYDCKLNISNNENPATWSLESNVKSQRSLIISSNCGWICCLQILTRIGMRRIARGLRNYSDLCPCVDEELLLCYLVSNVE